MTELQRLDTSIARLDLALLRAVAAPADPLATHELAHCLDFLDRRLLPTGLGPEVDGLLAEAADLAARCRPALPTEPHPWWRAGPTEAECRASEQLRIKLLDLAAAISVLARD